MHRRLKTLLHDATGESTFVVAVFLDVRGFSSWMKDSSQSALYLKSVYTKILDDYFPDADFFKPTGDGLLVVYRYREADLKATLDKAVRRSIELANAFGGLTDGDPMVNFVVPKRLGIGLARGSATRLVSGRQTLDYSGHPLNLAARLMDLARPSGVVFDETFGGELLAPEISKAFSRESVYIKGIADETPVGVYVLKGQVSIPQFNRHPINSFQRRVGALEKATMKDLADRGNYLHPLDVEPVDRGAIKFYVRFPKVLANGRKHASIQTTREYDADFAERQGKIYARVNYAPIIKELSRAGVKPGWEGEVWLEYPIRGEAPSG